jgi:hypothetical protein
VKRVYYLYVARRLRRIATDLVKAADDLDRVRLNVQPSPRKPQRNDYMRGYRKGRRLKARAAKEIVAAMEAAPVGVPTGRKPAS